MVQAKLPVYTQVLPASALHTSVWVTDMASLPCFHILVFSTTAGDIQFYDTNTTSFERLSRVTSLPSCPTTLHFHESRWSTAKLLWGDEVGLVLVGGGYEIRDIGGDEIGRVLVGGGYEIRDIAGDEIGRVFVGGGYEIRDIGGDKIGRVLVGGGYEIRDIAGDEIGWVFVGGGYEIREIAGCKTGLYC